MGNNNNRRCRRHQKSTQCGKFHRETLNGGWTTMKWKKTQPSSIPKMKMSTMDDCSRESAHTSTTHTPWRANSESGKEHHRLIKNSSIFFYSMCECVFLKSSHMCDSLCSWYWRHQIIIFDWTQIWIATIFMWIAVVAVQNDTDWTRWRLS